MKMRRHQMGIRSRSGLCAVLLAALLPLSARAAEASDFAGKSEMNGYRLEDYRGFEKNWKLVTVRFRKDTGELRFTYANPLAWKTLRAGKSQYPDGAVFAKVGAVTEEDPAFPSSAVPTGTRRYQLMVRNAKRHADTGGWGYALFDFQGKTFPEDPALASKACAACHALVPERGFVFSQPFAFSGTVDPAASAAWKPRLNYETLAAASLPEFVAARVPGRTSVRALTGEIRVHVFQGTLDEIRPALAAESARSGMPALLLSADGKRYSLVYPDSAAPACAGAKQKPMRAEHNLMAETDKRYETKFCYPL